MKKTRLTILVAVSVLAAAATIRAGTIAGKVSDPSGKALAGAMVSAFDNRALALYGPGAKGASATAA